MAKTSAKKEKWTLSFDATLKALVVRAARRRHVYPVAVLEELVTKQFNPFGHTEITDSTEYVKALRREARKQTDQAFLDELRTWRRQRSW